MSDVGADSHQMMSSDEIMQLAANFQKSRVLLSAYELGLFSALGRNSQTSDEVASLLGTDVRATDRLLNALCALGLVRKQNDRFSNIPAGLRFLVRGSEDYLSALEHFAILWKKWNNLTEAVLKGGTIYSEPFKESSTESLRPSIAAMHQWGLKRAPEVVARLDLKDVSRMLDVGGGSGVYAMNFVRACPTIKATVFDLPAVIPLTRQYIAGASLSERIDTVAGDHGKDELGRGFDLALLSSVICLNAPEDNLTLLDKVARALNPGGRVVILDFIIDEDRTGPIFSALFALTMLLGTESGNTYTESEIRLWLKLAGFEDIYRADSVRASAMIIGHKRPK